LSPALERELVLAAAAGDPAARELLVGAFMPAISGIARYYRRPGSVDRDELLQEGVVGLMRALSRFDPDVGTPFWGYASWWVRQAMQHLVAEVARPTVLSDRALRGLARVREARRADLQREGREPTVGELAEQVGLPREHVECLLAVERAPRGLEEPVGSNPSGTTTLRDTLADPVGEDAYENVLDDFGVEDLRDLAESLGEREREVLFDHFGLGRAAKTLREIGEGLGVSAERVRQIEAQALAKLRSRSDAGA
jgi:RNA polymerase sigma factor (sigma-70 family)